MELYDNGCYMWDNLVLGMARALIGEAKEVLYEEDNHTYDDYLPNIDENSIDNSALEVLVNTAKAYCKAGLLVNKNDDEYTIDEGIDLFFDLYFGNNRHLSQENKKTTEFF